ncbi:MAG: FAD-dependent oxidoreductase [Verrucomicrobiales bacterium]|nr:FAD-dependent oxidoreductase [Verrucomicrobiales bacterium]
MKRRDALQFVVGGGVGAVASTGFSQDRVNPENRPIPPRRSRKATGEIFGTNERLHVRTSGKISGDWFEEGGRNIPLRDSSDVIVCGGGPAGFTAALAAARRGANVTLIEVNGTIGGVWTSGLLSWILDAVNKKGIMEEITGELKTRGMGRRVESAWVYDAEQLKMLLEEMLVEAGVKIRLHTRVVGAVADDSNRLTAILTESKSGREAWTAKNFIDCTGDGDLAAQAGCEFEFGRPADGVTQPFSMMGILSGVSTDEIAAFIRGQCEPRKLGNPKKNFLTELRSAGIDPSYGGPTIFEIREGLYAMMANHQYNVSAINADDVSKATIEGRKEVHAIVNALKKKGGIWQDLHLNTTSEQIGTREGRRIMGRYYMTGEDLRTGAQFEDNICDVTFPIDVHATDPKVTKAIESKPFRSKNYQIPLRALFARDVDGLLVAGRCISGDFIAHSSYRVTGNAVAMGEAAGVAAAIAVQENALPHEVPFEALGSQKV